MESLATTFTKLGFHHILDPQGYDHIVFVIALCAGYSWQDWKKVAWLVTAFTVGHSLTLALAALDWIVIDSDLVEFLIPVTIIITALYNLLAVNFKSKVASDDNTTNLIPYFIASFFGLIHGMGFSNFFKSTVMPGETGIFLQQLLFFNIGVELGQLCVIFVILTVAYLIVKVLGVSHRYWSSFVSIISILVAISLFL